jgi:membrane-associated phospholipid phosphatase
VLVVPLLQILCLVYAAVCALTRVTDHRHHWWDVLVGAVMGLGAVLYTVRNWTNIKIYSRYTHDCLVQSKHL